jgi:hypothetical protein
VLLAAGLGFGAFFVVAFALALGFFEAAPCVEQTKVLVSDAEGIAFICNTRTPITAERRLRGPENISLSKDTLAVGLTLAS